MRPGRCSRFGCSAAAQRWPFPLLRSSGGGVSDGDCSPPFGGLDMAVLPPASLRSLGYPQCAAGKNKGKRKVKGGSMPAKPLSMRVSRGGGERNITKAERNITKAERNITQSGTQHHSKRNATSPKRDATTTKKPALGGLGGTQLDGATLDRGATRQAAACPWCCPRSCGPR